MSGANGVQAAGEKALDDWRRTEPDVPTRAEALRRIAARALKIKDERPEKPAKDTKKR